MVYVMNVRNIFHCSQYEHALKSGLQPLKVQETTLPQTRVSLLISVSFSLLSLLSLSKAHVRIDGLKATSPTLSLGQHT